MIGIVPPVQLDLFDPPSPLVGLRVVRSELCPKCRSFIAVIGTGNRGPVFVIKLQPVRSDSDGNIRGLRWILKTLLLRHGFRCITAHEEPIQMKES
jgi:hypothetical protein